MPDTRFINRVIVINGAVPLALLLWDASQHQLGADPTNSALHTTGLMALIFLSLSLSVTPLRKLTGLNWLISFRRTLGLFAFFYACVHFFIYFEFDRAGNISSTFSEIWKRWYLLIGATALLAMTPLALTSTQAMMKRLGGKRWQALHRLAYLAAGAGAIHYYMQAKADKRQPTVFLVVVVILLGYRLVMHSLKPRAGLSGGENARATTALPAAK